MASDGSWQRPGSSPAPNAAGPAEQQPGSQAAQQPDPLEELARIMDQTNPRQTGSSPVTQDEAADASNSPAFDNSFDESFDDFNALLANEGLVPELPQDEVIADPYLDDQLMQPELSADDLLADLDFGDLGDAAEKTALSEPLANEPAVAPPPLISDYLSPRVEPAQPDDVRLDDNERIKD